MSGLVVAKKAESTDYLYAYQPFVKQSADLGCDKPSEPYRTVECEQLLDLKITKPQPLKLVSCTAEASDITCILARPTNEERDGRGCKAAWPMGSGELRETGD